MKQSFQILIHTSSDCRLQNVDLASNAAELANGSKQLLIDISTISHEVLKEGSLYQVIGELHRADHQTELGTQAVSILHRYLSLDRSVLCCTTLCFHVPILNQAHAG